MGLGVREMNDDDIMFLQNYAVTSIVQPEDCADAYDAILTPCPRPKVTLRIRKQDLTRLALATETTAGDWYLNVDTGELSSGRGSVDQVVSVEVEGEELHFYGIRKEQNDE
jgi:hypothetical protein